jgi:hypothetical protein
MKSLQNRIKILKAFVTIVLALAAVLAGAWLYGAYRWIAGTQELRAQLYSAREPVSPQTVDLRELEGLPALVQRYFRVVLKEGQPMVAGVRVQQSGTFNMGDTADQWKPSRRIKRWLLNSRASTGTDASP